MSKQVTIDDKEYEVLSVKDNGDGTSFVNYRDKTSVRGANVETNQIKENG